MISQIEHRAMQAAGRRQATASFALPAALSFLVVLTACLWYQLSCLAPRLIFWGDSGYYLESCQLMVAYWQAMMSGSAASAGHLFYNLFTDGPMMPLVPALAYLFAGKVPAPVDWQPFVLLQSLTIAASAALVTALTGKLTASWRWALAAGLCFGLYPPAIIAAGRFLSEIPSAFLLLALVWLAAELLQTARIGMRFFCLGLAVGCCNGCILLLKPSLLLCCLAVSFLAFMRLPGWKQRGIASAAITTGLCLLLLPWAGWCKQMSGHAYLMPLRNPVYNMAKGCDIEADGWGGLPDAPLAVCLADSRSMLSTMVAVARAHPGQLFNLMLRKCTRLWSQPWNDFRARVFGVSLEAQWWWHIILVVLAVPGALAVMCRLTPWAPESPRRGTVVGLACIAVILGHASYVPFETLCRYGFSAMPFIVILAIYGLFAAWRAPALRQSAMAMVIAGCCLAAAGKPVVAFLMQATNDFRMAMIIELACRLLLLAAGAAAGYSYLRKARLDGRTHKILRLVWPAFTVLLAAVIIAFFIDGRQERQWACRLAPGQTVTRRLFLSTVSAKAFDPSGTAIVLIDGDSGLKGARVAVNGRLVPESPGLLLRRRPGSYWSFNIMQHIAGRCAISVEDLRQWRVVSFPCSWLARDAYNSISITSTGPAPVTIYGDYQDSWHPRRQIPGFDYFSAGMICNETNNFEGRLEYPVGLPVVSSQYRIFLAAPRSLTGGRPGPMQAPPTPVMRKLCPDDFDVLIGYTQIPGCDLRINKHILKAVSKLSCQVTIPPSVLSRDYLRIKISGCIRSAAKPCKASVLPVLLGSGVQSMVLPATPPGLEATAAWRRFQIEEEVPSNLLAGPRALEVSLFPGPWEDFWEYGLDRTAGDACLKGLTVEFEPLCGPRFDDKSPVIL